LLSVSDHAQRRPRAKWEMNFHGLRFGVGGRVCGSASPRARGFGMRWDNHLPRMSATDATTTLAELKKRILAFSHEREWEQFHAPKNLSMALAAEAGELMEHFLWATSEASRTTVQDPVKRAKIEEELADVIIYALEFANMTGIDAAAAIERKMAANAKKYPVEKARGRSDKYTEL